MTISDLPTSSARELLRAEDVAGAMAQLKEDVRRAPRDARLRVFLFQMFCVTGEWDRALTQLSVASELDSESAQMAQAYRSVIRCEILRERVFAGGRTPTVFGDPSPWVSLLVEANRLLASGAPAEAAQLRDQAFEDAPATGGRLNDQPFEWIADADQRLGPMVEAIIDGKYLWVPFSRIGRIDAEPPADLRDQVWMPVQFTWANGGETMGFMPTRYPGSATSSAGLALSRRTEWRDEGDWALGLGQRMFATDAEDLALLDLRHLVLTHAAEEGESSPAADALASPVEPAASEI